MPILNRSNNTSNEFYQNPEVCCTSKPKSKPSTRIYSPNLAFDETFPNHLNDAHLSQLIRISLNEFVTLTSVEHRDFVSDLQ